MRIVHFTGSFLPSIGGAESVVHNLALEQARMGNEVFVLNSWSRRKREFKRQTQLPYRMISLPPRYPIDRLFSHPLRRMGLSAWLCYLQRRFQFNTWHLHYAYPVGSSLPLLQRMGIEPVLTCHGVDINTVPAIGYGLRLDPEINREIVLVLNNCKKVVAISNGIRKQLVELGCAPHHIYDIPNGVSFDRMNSVSREAAATMIRSRYGLPPRARIILTIGRNHRVKRYDLIPPIIQSLAGMRKDFVWIVLGDACESLREMLPDCIAHKHLRILGPVGAQKQSGTDELLFPGDEVIRILRASDIFVSLSLVESFSLIVLESLAAGTPVIGVDAPGVRDLVEDSLNGLLLQDARVDQLAHSINRLLSDPEMRKQMGTMGQQKAREYDWSAIARKYVDLYSQDDSLVQVVRKTHGTATLPQLRE